MLKQKQTQFALCQITTGQLPLNSSYYRPETAITGQRQLLQARDSYYRPETAITGQRQLLQDKDPSSFTVPYTQIIIIKQHLSKMAIIW